MNDAMAYNGICEQFVSKPNCDRRQMSEQSKAGILYYMDDTDTCVVTNCANPLNSQPKEGYINEQGRSIFTLILSIYGGLHDHFCGVHDLYESMVVTVTVTKRTGLPMLCAIIIGVITCGLFNEKVSQIQWYFLQLGNS